MRAFFDSVLAMFSDRALAARSGTTSKQYPLPPPAMNFENPVWLYLTPLIVLFLAGLVTFGLRRREALLGQFAAARLLDQLTEKASLKRSLMKAGLIILACALIGVALARPQYGNSYTEVEASGIDILLAVDVSGSMEAMDFTLDNKPSNRLAAVKKVVNNFIEDRPNDRIGLLAFSGKPYLVSPLTLDHDWLRKRLDALRIGMIDDNGTAIGSAIASALNRLRERKSKSKIVILLTDGISNTGKIAPITAADAAETLGIKIYTIGAGTHGEAPMPVRDQFGRKRLMQVKVDIDEKTLKKVAEMTGASYFRATDTASLKKIYKEINKMEKTTRKIKRFENYTEIFPWFLFVFLIVFTIELYHIKRRIP